MDHSWPENFTKLMTAHTVCLYCAQLSSAEIHLRVASCFQGFTAAALALHLSLHHWDVLAECHNQRLGWTNSLHSRYSHLPPLIGDPANSSLTVTPVMISGELHQT